MIRLLVSRPDGQYGGFVLEGHAEYAGTGEDIVCAAVSALAFNTVNSIEMFTDDGFEAEQREEGGYLKFTLTDAPSDGCRLLLDSLVLGIQNIQDAYGDEYISISIEE